MSVECIVEAAVKVGKAPNPDETRRAVNALLDAIDSHHPDADDQVVEQIVDLAYDLKRHVRDKRTFTEMTDRLQHVLTVKL